MNEWKPGPNWKPGQPYPQPPIAVGDPVLWYADGDTRNASLPGIVVRKGEQCLELTVFDIGAKGVYPKSGVKHITTPKAPNEDLRDTGRWDHTGQHKLVLELRSQIEALETDLGKKPAPVAGPPKPPEKGK